MGNDSSKNAVCTSLSSKKVARLRSKIIEEYPWLRGVEESMLITDCLKEDNPIVYANQDFNRMTQYSPAEVIGFNCRFLQGKHTNPKTVQKIREAVQNGKELEVELLNYRKDGTPFINNFLMVPLHAKKSNPSLVTHFIAVQKDVTYLVQENDPTNWKPAQVALWLEKAGYEEFVGPFIENDVCGRDFLQLNESKLKKLGISDVTIQGNILKLISMLSIEGPGFVYELRNISDRGLSSERTESSEQNFIEYAFETGSDGINTDVDLHKPKASAYWRRRTTDSSSDSKENNQDSKLSSIEVHCYYRDLESHTELHENVLIQPNSFLFQLKNTIRTRFQLEGGISLSIKLNGEWVPIKTQQEFKALIGKAIECNERQSIEVNVNLLPNLELFGSMLSSDDSSGLYVSPRDSNIPVNSKRRFSRQETHALLASRIASITGEQSSGIDYSFIIPINEIGKRALLYDTIVKSGKGRIRLSQQDNIWNSLNDNDGIVGSCFIIPATSYGKIYPQINGFRFEERCNELLKDLVEKYSGEIPLGTCILVRWGERFLILAVMARYDLLNDKASKDTYYLTMRNILSTIYKYNQNELKTNEIPILCPSGESDVKISMLEFPVYLKEDIPRKESKGDTEILKFGNQIKIGFDAFDRWKKCKSISSYQEYIPQFQKQLERNHRKAYLKKKQDQFLKYLTSGEISVRGLLDQEEVNWLIEASSFSGEPTSPFSSSRRVQRLANVALSALLTNKRFKAGHDFNENLQVAVVNNKKCLDWLLKMASAGSISLCPEITMNDLTKPQRVAGGGTCSVHKTTYKVTGQTVAMKVFNVTEPKEEIIHEITLMSLLRHPNVLSVIGWGLVEGQFETQLFALSPYASRGSLFNSLQKNSKSFTFDIKFKIIIQIANGLEYLHSLGIIHRDIKSMNILIDDDYTAYLGDIGSARIIDKKMTLATGTVSWMAPEVLQTQKYTEKVDIYSFGMLIYEVIVSEIPFSDLKTQQLYPSIIKGVRPSIPSTVPKGWNKLMTSMWHAKPQHRPSISEVIATLMQLKNSPF